MLTCYSLLLGARSTPGKGARFLAEDEETLREITARHFPEGFTVLNADGAWFDPEARRFIEEEARQVIVCTDRRGRLRSWCEELATALEQKELLVTEVGRAAMFRVRERRRGSSKAGGKSPEKAGRSSRAKGGTARGNFSA
jgi:Protein of unknown function (DUF3574).